MVNGKLGAVNSHFYTDGADKDGDAQLRLLSRLVHRSLGEGWSLSRDLRDVPQAGCWNWAKMVRLCSP